LALFNNSDQPSFCRNETAAFAAIFLIFDFTFDYTGAAPRLFVARAPINL
jgi:hypothetical protein